MSPLFVSAVIGLALTALTIGQVAPSISEIFHSANAEIGVSRENALIQQIVRYRDLEGNYPATVADLVTKGYWRTADNDNGYGGNYSFTLDGTKGLITISTTIADASRRAQYISNFRHTFQPVDSGGGIVDTTFVMPTGDVLTTGLPTSNSVAVTASAPSAATNTYWYDVSGSAAVLKVSDGSNWTATSTGASGGGIAAPSAANTVASAAALPATGDVGDIRYAYDSATATLVSYVWYNSQWVKVASR